MLAIASAVAMRKAFMLGVRNSDGTEWEVLCQVVAACVDQKMGTDEYIHSRSHSLACKQTHLQARYSHHEYEPLLLIRDHTTGGAAVVVLLTLGWHKAGVMWSRLACVPRNHRYGRVERYICGQKAMQFAT